MIPAKLPSLVQYLRVPTGRTTVRHRVTECVHGPLIPVEYPFRNRRRAASGSPQVHESNVPNGSDQSSGVLMDQRPPNKSPALHCSDAIRDNCRTIWLTFPTRSQLNTSTNTHRNIIASGIEQFISIQENPTLTGALHSPYEYKSSNSRDRG